jgi:hypothetical protein
MTRTPPELGDEAIRHAASAATELIGLLDTAAGSSRTDRVSALEEALRTLRAASVTIGMALADARDDLRPA